MERKTPECASERILAQGDLYWPKCNQSVDLRRRMFLEKVALAHLESTQGPSSCPYCKTDFTLVRGTSEDVIGIYSIQTDRLIAYQCPNCKIEWSRLGEIRNGN